MLESFSDPNINDSLPVELEARKVEFADWIHILPENEIEMIHDIYLKDIPNKKMHLLNFINRITQKPTYTAFEFDLITKNLKKFCFLRSKSLKKFMSKPSLSSKRKIQSHGMWQKTKKIMQKAAVFCLTAGIGASIYANITKDIDNIKYLNTKTIRKNTVTVPQPVIPSNILFMDTPGIKCISKAVNSPIQKIKPREFDINTIKDIQEIANNQVGTEISRFTTYVKDIAFIINHEFLQSKTTFTKYQSPDLPKISTISKNYIDRSISKITNSREKLPHSFKVKNFNLNKSRNSVQNNIKELIDSGFISNSSSQIYIGFWKNSRSRFKKHTATHVGYLIFNNNSIDILHARGRKIIVENISKLHTYKLKTVICINISNKQHRKFKKMVKKYSKGIKYYQRDRCARFVWTKARECGFKVPQNDAWNQRKWYLKSVNTKSNGQISPRYEIIYDFRVTKRQLKKSGPMLSYITPGENKICLN